MDGEYSTQGDILAMQPTALDATGNEVPCQRWNDGRSRLLYSGDSGVFDRRRYSVDVIDEATARDFVTRMHYSRSYPAAVFRVGLFGPGGLLEGVAVFSVPMNQRVVPAYTGLQPFQGVELGRFVLVDRAPRNSESHFLGQSFKLLRRERPQVKAVLSYSDPVPRRRADGQLVMPGHVGIIYQAHNGRYLGRGSARALHLCPDGRTISPRTLSKIRLGESGGEAAQKMLLSLGAPARKFGEDGATWVERVLKSGLFRAIKHAGNHCYAWSLGTVKERHLLDLAFRPALPYPKTIEN